MPAIEKSWTFPGFVDVHVHFRDPGVPEAETTASGLEAARRGGMACVVTMPNTTPPIDTPEAVVTHSSLRGKSAASPLELSVRGKSAASPLELSVRGKSAASPLELSVRGKSAASPLLMTSACITRGRLGREVADLEALSAAGAAFFTDDGSYVSDAKVLEEAMRRAHTLDRVVSQHALAPGLSEADCIRRDLEVCRVTGCRYHVQHISTAEGVSLVRAAQAEGLPVTAEATPHHILLTKDDIPPDVGGEDAAETFSTSNLISTFFKMAPPLATAEDCAEVRKAVKDGVIMFATDHAPHPFAKKNCAYERAANGIIGLETAVAITYGVMVEEEGMSVEAWAEAWWKKPLGILPKGTVVTGRTKVALYSEPYAVDVSSFASLSRNCPYDGMKFRAAPLV